LGNLSSRPVRPEDSVFLLDIILKPENRNSGIGTTLMQDILDAADKSGKAIRLYVEKFNPAFSLYRRLGFTVIDDTGVHYHMEKLPAAGKNSPGKPKAAGELR
jgi:ribosomal protein S18 acetylase RimI-like enzyme